MPAVSEPQLPSRQLAERKTHKRPSRAKRVIVHPLRYRSGEDAAWQKYETIRVHPAARQFPKLTEEALAGLTREIIPEDGTVRLTTPIVITRNGAIVDGRHRARILVEAGYADKLTRQIEARGGDWVTLLPKGVDPYLHAVRSQSTRRNLPAWQMALAILPRYRAAVAEGEAQRGKKGKKPGELSPAAAFCRSVAISRTVFNQIDRLDRRANWEDMRALRTRQIRLSELERRLNAAEPTGRPKSKGPGTANPRAEEPSSSCTQTSDEAPTGTPSVDIDCGPAVELINQLLTVKPDQLAEANAAVILAELEDVARDRLLHAARQQLDQKKIAIAP